MPRIERKYPRVKVAVQAELRRPLDDFPRRAQTANVSEGGCYVELLFTLEPMTRLDVVLWVNNEKVRAKAEVVCNHPHIGNGIRFVRMENDDREKLKRFLDDAQKTRGLPRPRKS
jgi:c-di-GMP-binding flagellar brake protein YcgR